MLQIMKTWRSQNNCSKQGRLFCKTAARREIKTMNSRNPKIHAISTGKVTIRPSQVEGKGADSMRILNVFLDRRWTEPLPIYAWAIEHPEGIFVVDTGETANTAEPGYYPRWHPYYRNVKTEV